MNKRIYFLIAILAFVFSSCEKTTDLLDKDTPNAISYSNNLIQDGSDLENYSNKKGVKYLDLIDDKKLTTFGSGCLDRKVSIYLVASWDADNVRVELARNPNYFGLDYNIIQASWDVNSSPSVKSYVEFPNDGTNTNIAVRVDYVIGDYTYTENIIMCFKNIVTCGDVYACDSKGGTFSIVTP